MQVQTKKRKNRQWILGSLVVVASLALSAAESRADVTVSVTHNAPLKVTANDLISFTFSADLTGQPNPNNECVAKAVSYVWSGSINGGQKDSNGNPIIISLSGTGATLPVSHTAHPDCQSYSISASCTITYSTSPECQPASTQATSGSSSATIEVDETPCDA